MLIKLKNWYSPGNYTNEEDRQAAGILLVIMVGSLVTCFLTILGGLYWKELPIIASGVLGMLLQIIPLVLYVQKRLDACGFFVGLNALIVVTFSATLGQGIHDISIMAYPVVILIASLIMHRARSLLLTLLAVGSIIWLVCGEAFGLFVPVPTRRPSLADFLIMAAILAVAALAVNLQAGNMRNNLKKAQQEITRRKGMEEQLRYLGTHDILTGVYNRLFFDEEFARLEQSREYPLSVLVADLDNLKETNDSLGHSAGDETLKRASTILRSAFRQEDILARIGGDEFAVLLPSTGEESLPDILARIRAKIDENNAARPDLPVEMSIGVATAKKGALAQAFIDADRRMYEDKASRKNKS